MGIKRIQTATRMSQAVVHNGICTTAGVVALTAPAKSMKEQTKDILDRIDELLAEAGTDKSNILTATIWITDMAEFAEMNSIWDAWVSPGNAPTRACVESNLASPDFCVEIQVTAVV